MVDAEYHRSRRAKRKAKLISMLGGKCVACGSVNNLHFDHIDPSTKKFQISKRLTSPDDNLTDELNKCQLLCADCHRAKTKENWDYAQPESPHGSLWRYKKYKCRCDLCRAAVSDYYHSKAAMEKFCNGLKSFGYLDY